MARNLQTRSDECGIKAISYETNSFTCKRGTKWERLSALTDRDEEIELVIPPVFNYCTKVLDPNEQIAARDLYWEAICSDDRKDRDWEKVEKVLLESIKASFGRASGAASRVKPVLKPSAAYTGNMKP